MFFETLANFFNAVIAAFQRIANFQPSDLLPDVTLPDLNPLDDETTTTERSDEGDIGDFAIIGGHLVTNPENIGAQFTSTGSSAWVGQWQGLTIDGVNMENRHGGIDFRANEGSPVYAPYPGTVIKVGSYTDSGRFGDYVIMTLADGAEYYSGHLKNVTVKTGDYVPIGTQIGETNHLNHTHVQLKIDGQIKDFLKYREAH